MCPSRSGSGVFHQRAGRGAIVEAFAAAGALLGDDLVEVPRFEKSGADRRERAHLAAEAAGIARREFDADFHRRRPTQTTVIPGQRAALDPEPKNTDRGDVSLSATTVFMGSGFATASRRGMTSGKGAAALVTVSR